MLGQMDIETLLGIIGPALAIGAVVIVIAAFSLGMFIKQRSRLLLYFFLTWLSFGTFIIFDAFSTSMDIVLLYKITYSILTTLIIVFWFAFIDNVMHEQIGIKKMIIAFVGGTVLGSIVWLFDWKVFIDPETLVPKFYVFPANPLIDGIFFESINVFFSLIGIGYIYWAAISYKKSPPALKKKTGTLFALGIILVVGLVIQFYPGDPVVVQMLLLMQSVIIVVVILGTILIIRSEPRIAHLLPYTVYKIIVTSKNGPKYYTKSWADSGIDDDMLAGLMSAIGTVVKNTLQKIKTGAISEIKMYKGVMLTEMRYLPVNIVLVASRASSALKSSLEDFGEEFMKVFYNDLYDKDGFAKEVLDGAGTFTSAKMEPLIEKYFHNVPTFIATTPADLPGIRSASTDAVEPTK
jgi:hypothetical protein